MEVERRKRAAMEAAEEGGEAGEGGGGLGGGEGGVVGGDRKFAVGFLYLSSTNYLT